MPGRHLRDALAHGPHQLDVERVARPVPDDVAAQVLAQERQVAEDVENLVAGRLVGEAQSIVDRAVRTEDHQVAHACPPAKALLPQSDRFFLEQECAATGDPPGEAGWSHVHGAHLPADRRPQAVVKQIAHPQAGA